MTFTNTQTKLGQAITTNDSGDYAVRTIIEGDQTLGNLTLTGDLNGGGGYISNDQTTTNMMSKGTVYRFDGVNDNIGISTLAAHLVNTNNTMGAIFWSGTIDDAVNDIGEALWGFGDTNAGERMMMSIASAGSVLQVECFVAGVNQWRFTTDANMASETELNIVLVQNGTSPVLYINGVLEPITFSTSTDLTSWFHETTGIDNGYIGARSFSSVGIGAFFSGTCSFFDYLNFAPTAAQIKNIISGNLDFKWQYGSQTSLVTNGDMETGDPPTGWVANNATLSGEAVKVHSGSQSLKAIDAGDSARASRTISLVEGKEYNLSGWYLQETGSQPVAGIKFDVGTSAGGAQVLSSGFLTTLDAWTEYTVDFTSPATGTYYITLQVGGNNGEIAYFDDVSITQLGAVALYDQTSISETYWYDKANGNDGAVTGASVLNAQETLYVTGSGKVEGLFGMGDYTLLTIASGVITATSSLHYIETESAGATDDLDTINGGEEGNLLIIAPGSSARTVVAKDGTGNLVLAGDFTMDDATDMLLLIKIGANWRELSRSAN